MPVLVGFAAETGSLDRAAEKLRRKRVDFLVANDVAEPGSGFGTETNRVSILAADGSREDLPLQGKRAVAERLLDHVARALDERDAAAADWCDESERPHTGASMSATTETVRRLTVVDIAKLYADGQRIPMLTAYDFPTAQILDQAGIPMLLVGDSVGQVMLGYESTVRVTMAEMVHHTRAVVRGTRARAGRRPTCRS